MFKILWFLIVALLLASSLVWMLENNGNVVINWLGYEVQTSVLVAIFLAIFCALLIFSFSYLLARILAIKFPNLLKIFFKKNHLKKLEKIIHRHHQSFDLTAKLLLSLEVEDKKSAIFLQKKVAKLLKNQSLNNFFLAKIALIEQDFDESAKIFDKFSDDKNAKILVLKSKLNLATQKQDEQSAIAYAKQILAAKSDDLPTVKKLFLLYKKHGFWQEAKSLISTYGSEKFQDELQKHDIAIINSALAFEAYHDKKFLLAIKYSNIALKAENNFLPAQEIALKSWLKLGFKFKVSFKIKSLWRECPHLIFAEIFDLIHRKSNAKNRINAIKKLAASNTESPLGKLAIGMVAFKCGAYKEAKDFLELSLLENKSYRAYKLLAFCQKHLGNVDQFKKNLLKSQMLAKTDHYFCNSCGEFSSKWNAKCHNCSSYDSLEWNS
jgi:HemY protein